MALGVYISVPFCRTKCSFCNFASDVFSRAKMQGYVDRVIADMAARRRWRRNFEAELPREADSIYLGGGTPSTLAPEQLVQLFDAVRKNFDVGADAEVTVECAPGTLTPEMIATLLRCGVNRVSLGVQSFVDQESRAVGRLHTAQIVLDDIARLRAAGISEISVDLIAGLPHQTRESWESFTRRRDRDRGAARFASTCWRSTKIRDSVKNCWQAASATTRILCRRKMMLRNFTNWHASG